MLSALMTLGYSELMSTLPIHFHNPNSIKFMKFGTFEEWVDRISSTFGVVKYEKKTHFFNGSMVQTHYQLLNTLHLTKDEMREFLKPNIDFIDLLKNDPAVLRWYIEYPEDRDFTEDAIQLRNDIVFNLLGINEDSTRTAAIS